MSVPSMQIGFDVRCLTSPQPTGVAEYTSQLLAAVLAQPNQNDWWLFYNAYRDVGAYVPHTNLPNVQEVVTSWPNKLFHVGTGLGIIELDKHVQQAARWRGHKLEKLDWFFSPNLHFTNLSRYTKCALTIHDLTFELYPQSFSLRRRLWHRAVRPEAQAKRADIIFTPSENTRRDVCDFWQIDPKKVRVLYPGMTRVNAPASAAAREIIRAKYNLPNKFIFFLGTIEPRKNILTLVEAYKKLVAQDNRFRDYQLVVAGAPGWNDSKIQTVLARTPGVRYLGYIEAADKPTVFSLAALFVYPSMYEGFGLPILEAFAAGTPVITSNRSSLPEVGGAAAYYVDPHDTGELVVGMQRILGDEKLAADYRAKGLEQAKKFSWGKSAVDFLGALES